MDDLTYSQAKQLLKAVTTTVPDAMGCDECSGLMAAFAEAELQGNPLTELLKSAQVHFSQCPCCAYEYETLLESVRAAEG